MIERNTVLVLGAGASMAYGLPSGAELKRKILGCSPSQLQQLSHLYGGQLRGQEQPFLTAFQRSHATSIDSFLSSRPDFMELGKAAIASVLLPCESAINLLDREPSDHWYQYLAEALHAPWDEWQNNRLSVITFNYDRSLEVFLETTLMHRHNKTAPEARQKLASVPILHVYGSLGSVEPTAGNFVPYGGDDRSGLGNVALAARQLVVIPEGRENSPEFERAKALLADAEVIGFLGFGFDQINVRRLGGTNIAAHATVDKGIVRLRTFRGTAFDMTEAERDRAAAAVTLPEARSFGDVRGSLLNMQCRQMLRETLLLAPD